MDNWLTKAVLSGSLRSAANTELVSMASAARSRADNLDGIGQQPAKTIMELEESNKELLELSLIHIERIAKLEAELSKLQRVTAIDQSFSGPGKEEV